MASLERLDMISLRARFVRSISVAGLGALVAVASCKGPIADGDIVPDGFMDGADFDGAPGESVGFGAGPGPTGVCAAGPRDVHAELRLDGQVLREDAKVGTQIGGDPIDVDGVFGFLTDTKFTVSHCDVADCTDPDVYELTLDDAGIPLGVPAGAFVRLRYLATDEGAFAVALDNLAVLDGMPNPMEDQSHPWFEVMHGFVDDAPFRSSFTLHEGCWTSDGTMTARDMYVAADGNPDELIEIIMGGTMPWSVATGLNAGSYDVTNLSSYAVGEQAFAALVVVWR
jgi:hypothetical protein